MSIREKWAQHRQNQAKLHTVRELARGTSSPNIQWRKIAHIPTLQDVAKTPGSLGNGIRRGLKKLGKKLTDTFIEEVPHYETVRRRDPYGFSWGKKASSSPEQVEERVIFDREQEMLRQRLGF